MLHRRASSRSADTAALSAGEALAVLLPLHRRGASGASFRGGGERPSFGFAPAASGPPAVLPLRAAGADAGRGATAARRSAAISATVDSFRFGAAVELRLSPGWR